MLEGYQGLLDPTLEIVPLNPADTEVYFRLAIMPEAACPALLDGLLKTDSGKLIFHRLQWAGVSIEIKMLCWLASISSSPGECVMWAYAVALMYEQKKRNPDQPPCFADWPSYFPNGYPSPKAMEKSWEAQKRRIRPAGVQVSDNWLDAPEQWPILREKGEQMKADANKAGKN